MKGLINFKEFVTNNTTLELSEIYDYKEGSWIMALRSGEGNPNKIYYDMEYDGPDTYAICYWVRDPSSGEGDWDDKIYLNFEDPLKPSPEECVLFEIEYGREYELLQWLTYEYKKELGL